MKKIALIAFVIFAGIACTNEYLAPDTVPSHSVIFTSEMDFGNRVQVNGRMTFGDVSAGIVSRDWTFPSGVDILGSDDDIKSTESVVKVVFKNAGQYEIKLHQKFQNEAFVNGKVAGTESDTTFVITVLDSVKVDMKVQKIDRNNMPAESLNLRAEAQNEIEAGKFVELTPELIGEPETVTWILEGATPSTISSMEPVRVKYKKLGVYDVKLIAFRNRPNGGDTLEYKSLIKVIPSSDPVTLDAVSNVPGSPTSIALNFSRDMDPASLNPANFNVKVTNEDLPISMKVNTVSLKAGEENVVMLGLSSPIYNDDEIEVSYSGALKTSDGVAANSFENKSLSFIKNNLLAASVFDEGFENSLEENWPYQWWGGIWGEYNLKISNTVSHSGNKSARIEYKPNGGMIIGHKVNGEVARFKAKSGKKYEIGYWLRVESIGKNKVGTGVPDIRFYWEPGTNWGVGGVELTEDLPLNKWVYIKAPYAEFNEDGDYQFWIRGFNENNPESVIYYLDDISISEVSLRPK